VDSRGATLRGVGGKLRGRVGIDRTGLVEEGEGED
jgi:hypothetical protein